mgnify:CR=1 FL=1
MHKNRPIYSKRTPSYEGVRKLFLQSLHNVIDNLLCCQGWACSLQAAASRGLTVLFLICCTSSSVERATRAPQYCCRKAALPSSCPGSACRLKGPVRSPAPRRGQTASLGNNHIRTCHKLRYVLTEAVDFGRCAVFGLQLCRQRLVVACDSNNAQIFQSGALQCVIISDIGSRPSPPPIKRQTRSFSSQPKNSRHFCLSCLIINCWRTGMPVA